jgi:hypothetical protein
VLRDPPFVDYGSASSTPRYVVRLERASRQEYPRLKRIGVTFEFHQALASPVR